MDGFGCLDIVVNNVGILCDVIFYKMSVDDWLLVINVYFNGSFFVSWVVVECFCIQQVGVFVYMISIFGLIGNFGQVNYFVVKLGIVVLSKFIVFDMQCYNVCLNCIVLFVWSRMIDLILVEILEQKVCVDKLQCMIFEKNVLLVVYLVFDVVCEVIGQVFVVCYYEFFLMSQSWLLCSVYSEYGWILESIVEYGMLVLCGSFMDLVCSLDVFFWDLI